MRELRLDGKVVIVTGGGRGLGRSYARLLASRGASVLVNDPGGDLEGAGEDAAPARQVVAEIVGDGGRAVANFASVASEDGAQSMVAQALDAFGGLHIVINNAGIFTPACPLLEAKMSDFQRMWDVHVMGTINVVRAAWPTLIAQRYGRIVNVGSHTGYFGNKERYDYTAIKGAVHGFSMTLALEGAKHGIAVNVLAPGAGTRPVLSWAPSSFGGDAFAPDLVAPTALWLAHEDCRENGAVFSAISGNTSRIVIAETRGYQSRNPSAEAIAEHRNQIVEVGDASGSNLLFPKGAMERGAELIARYDRSANE